MDISVDFRTTERVSITQEGNLIHDRLFMKISVDDRSRMDESLKRIYKLRQTPVNKPFNITDLKLGWTVRWRTATGNKSCPIWG